MGPPIRRTPSFAHWHSAKEESEASFVLGDLENLFIAVSESGDHPLVFKQIPTCARPRSSSLAGTQSCDFWVLLNSLPFVHALRLQSLPKSTLAVRSNPHLPR